VPVALSSYNLLIKPSEDAESLVVYILKNWQVFDFGVFVGNIIMEAGLHIFGCGHQVLGTNPMSQFFGSSCFGN